MSSRAILSIVVFVATALLCSQQVAANTSSRVNGQRTNPVHYPGTDPVKHRVSSTRGLGVVARTKHAVKEFGLNLSRVVGKSKWPSKVLAPLEPLQESARYRFLKLNDKIASRLPPKLKKTYNALRDVNPVSAAAFIMKKLLEDPVTKGYGYSTIVFSKTLQASLALRLISAADALEIQGWNLAIDGLVLGGRTLQKHGFKGLLKLLGPDVIKHTRVNREAIRWYGDVFIKPTDKNTPEKGERGPITPSM